MAKSKSSTKGDDVAFAVGGTALIASILGNLSQHSEKQDLRNSIQALQRIVADWQSAYHTLDAQLEMALSANDELNQMVQALRNELRQTQARVYAAEARALKAEHDALSAAASAAAAKNELERLEAGKKVKGEEKR